MVEQENFDEVLEFQERPAAEQSKFSEPCASLVSTNDLDKGFDDRVFTCTQIRIGSLMPRAFHRSRAELAKDIW